jgi:hypothetical protein
MKCCEYCHWCLSWKITFVFTFYPHYFNDWSSEVDLSAFADIHIVILFLGSRSIEEVPLKKKESVVDNMLRPQNIDCFT